jgi:diguanylate cyclase (GGDEF)-like protein
VGAKNSPGGVMSDALSIFSEITVWPLGVLAVFAFLLGILIGRIAKAGRASRRSVTTEAGSFVDLEVYRESQKAKARLEQENVVFAEFFLVLTDFTKEMDGRQGRANVARRLVEVVDRIFLPGQILVFLAERKDPGSLVLRASKGFSADSGPWSQVRIGEGKIGLVAEQRIAMDQEDFLREMKARGGKMDASTHFRFNVELCVPMLAENGNVQGVISAGGITRHPKFEKRLLTTIGDLGGIALLNNDLMEDQKRKANSDGLTGLINKRYLKDLLGEAIHKAEVQQSPVSVFLFDLDHFKRLNDKYGHLTGDRVLQGTAEVLRRTVRDGDIAARWGGEEFLVILPGTPKEGAWLAAEKVRKSLEIQVFQDEDGKPVTKVTLSGGVATFPEDGRQQSELVAAADKALYRAKQAGRNRIVKAEPEFLSAFHEGPVAKKGSAA